MSKFQSSTEYISMTALVLSSQLLWCLSYSCKWLWLREVPAKHLSLFHSLLALAYKSNAFGRFVFNYLSYFKKIKTNSSLCLSSRKIFFCFSISSQTSLICKNSPASESSAIIKMGELIWAKINNLELRV